MKNLLVFNDSHQLDGCEWSIKAINDMLSPYDLKINFKFIEDFISDEGEYAVELNLKKKGESK